MQFRIMKTKNRDEVIEFFKRAGIDTGIFDIPTQEKCKEINNDTYIYYVQFRASVAKKCGYVIEKGFAVLNKYNEAFLEALEEGYSDANYYMNIFYDAYTADRKLQVYKVVDGYLNGYASEFIDKIKDIIDELAEDEFLFDRFCKFIDDEYRIADIHSYLNRDSELEYCDLYDKASYKVLILKDLQKNAYIGRYR